MTAIEHLLGCCCPLYNPFPDHPLLGKSGEQPVFPCSLAPLLKVPGKALGSLLAAPVDLNCFDASLLGCLD